MGRLGGRRSLVIGVRPRRSIPRARRAHASRLVPGAGDRSDGVHHLARLQPGDRAVPDGGRRLPRRDQPHRPARGARVRRRADRRLRADDRYFCCQRRRCAVQLDSCGRGAVQARHGTRARGVAAGNESARHEGIHTYPAADFRRILRHARDTDRLRDSWPLARASRSWCRTRWGRRDSSRTTSAGSPQCRFSCALIRSAAALIPASRRCRTTCKRCASPSFGPAS